MFYPFFRSLVVGYITYSAVVYYTGRSGSTSILTGPPPFSVTAMNQSATALASSVGGELL